MARPRKPTRILELNGAFKKDPQRRKLREGEAQPRGPLGKPPTDLSLPQLEAWNTIVAGASPGVLTSSDRMAVELCAMLWCRRRMLETPERAQLIKLLNDFGMTPRGRSYVKGTGSDEKKPDNPYAD